MTVRRGLIAALTLAVAAGIIEYGQTRSPVECLQAAGAGAVAGLVAAYALSLAGIAWQGLVVGGFFVGAGMLSWTFSETKTVVWGFLLAEGVTFAVLAWPWLRDLRRLPRLGTVWLGLAYWLFGIAAAVLVLKPGIAVQRVLYLGVFALAVLAVLSGTRRGGDLTVGVVAAFLLALAALTFAGAGNLFDGTHPVPHTGWGVNMTHRFWGGERLLYHPNSMAGIAVVIALRIGPDRAFAAWQRLAAVGIATGVVLATNSRTGFIFGAAGAILHAVLLWWRRPGFWKLPLWWGAPVQRLPLYRRRWLAAAVPFVALIAVFALSGGVHGFLIQSRYAEGGVSSGRLDTWKQVGSDWKRAPIAEKLFGDTSDSRATVIRESSGQDVKLTTDNAAVGSLRRGGVLGVAAFLLGLLLLLLRVTVVDNRRLAAVGAGSGGPPAWLAITVVAALPAIATTDWLLGGTGGTVWILLVAAEAVLALRRPASEPAPAAAG